LVLLDLDYFKSINDLFGHSQGDRVLTRFADALRSSLRQSDEAFRVGGEEFALLLRCADSKHAQTVTQRLRARFAEAPFDLGDESRVVTFSAGVATVEARNEFDAVALFDRADRALYRAKASGRDRIELESDTP
jgi:diguanylate cyclase (GGDEF)-like protein